MDGDVSHERRNAGSLFKELDYVLVDVRSERDKRFTLYHILLFIWLVANRVAGKKSLWCRFDVSLVFVRWHSWRSDELSLSSTGNRWIFLSVVESLGKGRFATTGSIQGRGGWVQEMKLRRHKATTHAGEVRLNKFESWEISWLDSFDLLA